MALSTQPRIDTLVLDAAPLLSLTPLRGLARRYFTTPQVVAELKDQKAREHWEQLSLLEGVEVVVRNPAVDALSKVNAFSKKTGDYAVLSHPDLCVLALTLELHEAEKGVKELEETVVEEVSDQVDDTAESNQPEDHSGDISTPVTLEPVIPEPTEPAETPKETLAQRLQRISLSEGPTSSSSSKPYVSSSALKAIPDEEQELPETVREPLVDPSLEPPAKTEETSTPLYEDPSDEDDGEGEWITPTNVNKHKEQARQGQAITTKQDNGPVGVACMTSDFAMQNVLLQMGLNLVGVGGKKIAAVKTWVLRCHACFKICKDSSKKFCPSCGNPTLLRTSVTTKAAKTPGGLPTMQVHLKKNFQYRNRGAKYDLPPPKMNHAKGGGTSSIILREDQIEWERGMRSESIRAHKQEKRLNRAMEEKEKTGGKVWTDPDWLPDLLVGSGRNAGSVPVIGHGRRNPNEPGKKKK